MQLYIYMIHTQICFDLAGIVKATNAISIYHCDAVLGSPFPFLADQNASSLNILQFATLHIRCFKCNEPIHDSNIMFLGCSLDFCSISWYQYLTMSSRSGVYMKQPQLRKNSRAHEVPIGSYYAWFAVHKRVTVKASVSDDTFLDRLSNIRNYAS